MMVTNISIRGGDSGVYVSRIVPGGQSEKGGLRQLYFYSLPRSLIAYRIFSVYQKNTKTIHLIMMIWLVSFILSNYKLASGPPKDPGGSKKILSKSKDIDS